MSQKRLAKHAGTWYSSDPAQLDDQLEEWLQSACATLTSQDRVANVRAIIAPHAGLRYSGSNAAFAYCHLLDNTSVERIFVLGPSHHYSLKGCALSSASGYDTPLGSIPIDQDINDQLIAKGRFARMTMKADEEEHSIEMHLPFIAKIMKKRQIKLVSILVGYTSSRDDVEYARILAPFMQDLKNFFIVSSDFCHWGSRFHYQPYSSNIGEIHEYIKHLDHEAMQLIQEKDTERFTSYLEQSGNTICGRHPISILLQCVQSLEQPNLAIKFVHYSQSSACNTMKDSSVSYASAVVYEIAE